MELKHKGVSENLSRALLVVLIGLGLLGGCSSIDKTNQAVSQLGASLYAPRHYMDENYSMRLSGLERGSAIDSKGREFLSDYLNKINYDYAMYVTNLTSGKASLNVTYDSTNLGLTGAAAVVTPVATKTAFAALSTFFQGQKQSIDKNIFDDKAVFALTSIMEIRRTEVLGKIRRSLLNKEYTLGDALLDLDEYYRSGTLQTALQASFLNQQRLDSGQPTSAAPAASAASGTAGAPSSVTPRSDNKFNAPYILPSPAYPSSTNPFR
ncbi:hypothetical protein [Azohydromonas aeria]|uniref:hypothetical protein n=1 Tax=Azohydromonas aeria TaxID=2590212 RepID=UPI0012F73320|nr:hypothetical protein [Azohydromonas aeria]